MSLEIKEKRFEIDTDGFRIQMSEMPLWRLVQELISNSFDEESVRNIIVTVSNMPNNEIAVQVIDDGDGFKDYKDIFTLYKDSTKRVDPEQRGRFNLGEKQFFAVATGGSIRTGTWDVEFFDDQRNIRKTSMFDGTTISGIFKKPENETAESIVEELMNLVVPQKKILIINEIKVEPKPIVKEFKCILPTPIASGKNQKLVQVKRECTIVIYAKLETEQPIIYELGVPVQRLEESLKWHVDIRQKIPQTTSRDVVSDKYLQLLFSEIAKNTINLITSDDAGSIWIADAMKKTDESTSRELLKKIYNSDKVMIESTTDYRANEKAMEAGFTMIKGSTLDPEVRNNLIKTTGIIKYASKEYGTTYADAKHVEPNENMLWFAGIVKKIAKDISGKKIDVAFYSLKESDTLAQMGMNTMSFNVGRLGKKFFNNFNEQAVGIVIHELAHFIDSEECGQYAHLKMGFIRSMEIVAGKVGSKGIGYWMS